QQPSQQAPAQSQQPSQQAPAQAQQPSQQVSPGGQWPEYGRSGGQPTQASPQVSQQPDEVAQAGTTQQFERQPLAQHRGQETPSRQAIEMAETPEIAEVLATRLGMTPQQLAQYLPQLAPFLGGPEGSATGQPASTIQGTQPRVGQQPGPLSHQ
ncbi:MAG: hypothetical protein ACOCPT_05480, partial [Halanaeroarchaeum sp.]